MGERLTRLRSCVVRWSRSQARKLLHSVELISVLPPTVWRGVAYTLSGVMISNGTTRCSMVSARFSSAVTIVAINSSEILSNG